MKCLYITLFVNTVAGIVQTFIVLEPASVSPSYRSLPFEPRHDFFLHLIIVVELFSQRDVSLGEETSGNRWVTISSNVLFVNSRCTIPFCVEKSYNGTHLAFGGTLDRCCHFKHVSLKQSRFYHCQTSTAHR